ncbi:MAG: hypothetical protein QHC67_07295 [Sphingobium sp.]|uniref:hypothetical protein n=1 Tax=Sphingobium sp. TaxID=1912891 RepID=UPI0029BA9081|nr:hypothetical protein [Sphingobium sp.]MDX3909611.1 hypothetical protein [Sphingobium sp.]
MAIAKTFSGHGSGWGRAALWLAIGGLLLLPLVAMQFTDEVNWDGSDFAAAAAQLFGLGVALEFVSRIRTRRLYRYALCLAVVGLTVLIWAHAAVGIF